MDTDEGEALYCTLELAERGGCHRLFSEEAVTRSREAPANV
jgi:hypothetical protein